MDSKKVNDGEVERLTGNGVIEPSVGGEGHDGGGGGGSDGEGSGGRNKKLKRRNKIENKQKRR